MQFSDPNATPLDLRFRLFGTPVRVHPLFWLIMALLGWRTPDRAILPGNGIGDVLVWVACAFFSILLHEFGHVWMGSVFGARGQYVVLHSMGGLAFNADAPRRWQRILISAAGPGIQLLLFGVLVGVLATGVVGYAVSRRGLAEMELWELILQVALGDLLIMNLFWPLLNLLPIWPLDGGQITREVFTGVSPRQGVIASLWTSLIVSAALALNSALVAFGQPALIPVVGHYFGSTFMALFFALFAFGSFQAISEESRRRRRYWDDELPWER
jgi:stage IV sporulation protein FB